jgi:hypothetical protein
MLHFIYIEDYKHRGHYGPQTSVRKGPTDVILKIMKTASNMTNSAGVA